MRNAICSYLEISYYTNLYPVANGNSQGSASQSSFYNVYGHILKIKHRAGRYIAIISK